MPLLKPSAGLLDVFTAALGRLKQCSGLGTKETMSPFEAVLLGDSPLASRGNFSRGWPRLSPQDESECKEETAEEEKELLPGHKVDGTVCMTG